MWASKTYTFSPSTTIRSAEVNQDFDDCIDAINVAMPSSASGHGIILFSGAIADIPSGWYLCNGNNGTPNLCNRFVIGAGDTYAVGDTGGASTINIEHTHTMAHTHTYSGTTSGPSDTDSYDETNEQSAANSNHTHTYSGTTSAASSSTTSSGLSSAQSILPPYYALAYIMKA